MFHRFTTWWRALSVVLLSLAAVTWPSAAQASTTPSFSLVHQDVVAAFSSGGTSRIALSVALSRSDPKARAQVAIYPRLVDRSQITALVVGVGPRDRALATTRSFPIGCSRRPSITFSVGLYTKHSASQRGPCSTSTPQLHLHCVTQRCDGVYPLRITVTVNGRAMTKWSMVVLETSGTSQPLQVDLIETMDPSTWSHPLRATAVLNTIGHHPQSPVTLTADYRTLNDLQSATSPAAELRASLVRALASPLHQVVNAPPPTIDFAGLWSHGLGGEVKGQLSLSANLLKHLTGRYVDGPVLVGKSTSPADLVALTHAGVSEVVLPESDLVTAPSSTLTWGAPFKVPGVSALSALSVDDPLSDLAADSSIGPGLRSVLTLATLDFLHFEEPFAPSERTVVVTTPIATTSSTFVNDLFDGFRTNPFLQLATLSPSYTSSLIATNGAPAARSLRPGTASSWSARNTTSLASLIAGVSSYSQAVTSSNVGDGLRVAVALAERTGGPDARQYAITQASRALNAQLGNFSVDPSSITLAGPGTALPITLLSRANYTVTAVVHLITDRLSFPKGRDLVVVLDSPTKSIRVPTSNHQGSSLTLQVVVTTPDDQIVLARAAIQVRIAGTSIVGYLLTLASLLVLGFWWIRTYRRRSKGRHAR